MLDGTSWSPKWGALLWGQEQDAPGISGSQQPLVDCWPTMVGGGLDGKQPLAVFPGVGEGGV